MENQWSIGQASAKAVQAVVDGINAYNEEIIPATHPQWTPIELAVSDAQGQTIAGLLGGIGCWGGLEIKILWVSPNHRRKGIGCRLLNEAEEKARALGASITRLDTFDFQAKDFYLHHGYQISGSIENFPPGHQRYYCYKRL